MNYLLHTDILLAASQGSLPETFRNILEHTPPTHIHLSVIALAEALKTASAIHASWLRRIPTEYADRLIPIDAEIAASYAELVQQAREKGYTLELADGLVAATAIRYDLILLTRPSPAMAATGVRLVLS